MSKFDTKTLIKSFLIFLAFLSVFGLGIIGTIFYQKKFNPPTNNISETQQNKYVAFIDEVYTTITTNYWNKIEEPYLNDLFIKASSKLIGQPQDDQPATKQDLLKYIETTLNYYTDEQQKIDFTAQICDLVLANLEPFGRSRLYSQKMQEDLSNTVANKNPDKDRYDDLGVGKEATQEEIEQAHQKQSELWNPQTNESTQAAEKYQAIQEAYNVLKDEQSRQIYNESGVEPTMEYQVLNSDTLYLHLSKFSPTTFDELKRTTDKFSTRPELTNLILDLSNNIGGAIDGLPYFLGPFIGNDQYAYQFFHQGEKQDFKTKIGWLPGLVQYKKVVVLINGQAQSTAEMMASVLKKYNVGVLVGEKTMGWGTIERIFPLTTVIDENAKHSVFLVHSLTLREDGLPIQDNGVEPTILISASDWKNELLKYYDNQEFVNTVATAWKFNN